MRDLFNKPFEQLTTDDVRSVIGWPESLLVEFKQDLPSHQGRGDAWLNGGNVEQYAKIGIFKEVVALSNTSGGHVVLGVAESRDKPPVAARIMPIPRCVDLAERLERAAQAIDPPIPRLGAWGIPMQNDGSGIVLFRVPKSRNAPHRSIDKECYVRRGTASVPVTMREIQDMTITVGRRTDVIEQQFQQLKQEAYKWFSLPDAEGRPKVTGFRITAIPITTVLSIPRLFGGTRDLTLRDQYQATRVHTGTSSSFTIYAAHLPTIDRPIMRGVSFTNHDGSARFNLSTDGSVDLVMGFDTIRGSAKLFLGWIAAHASNVVRAADYLRTKAASPDSEYAIEFEILSHNQVPSLVLQGWGQQPELNPIGELSELPLTLPRLSFGPTSDINAVITTVSAYLHDAAGGRYPELPAIEIDIA